MVQRCIIEGCPSREYPNKERVHYYHVQRSDFDLYSDWIIAICFLNNQDVSNHGKTAAICSKHFTNDCFLKGFTNKLTTDAIPSLFPRSSNMEEQPVTNLLPEANQKDLSNVSITSTATNKRNLLPKANQKDLSNVPITSTATNKRIFLNKPIRQTKIRHLGDIKGNLNNLTPKMLVQYVGILNSHREKKKIKINNMKAKIFQQKRTITKLRVLLECYKQKNLISEDAIVTKKK